MRYEWIEDILSLIKAGSLTRAAEQCYLSQPALSRRIRAIEEYLGVEVLDRRRKPAQIRPEIADQRERLEILVSGFRDLLFDLRQRGRKTGNRVVIACQHAVTTSIAPSVVKRLSADMEASVRLLSANRDECFAFLLTKQADLTLTYRVPDEDLPLEHSFLEECDFGREDLVPVYATDALDDLNEQYRSGEVPVVLYPGDVFFGKVMSREILPKLRLQMVLRPKAETALTLAGLQLALAGVGVAWVPLSLAAAEIAAGNLTNLSHLFRSTPLSVTALRLVGARSPVEQDVWDVINGLKATMSG